MDNRLHSLDAEAEDRQEEVRQEEQVVEMPDPRRMSGGWTTSQRWSTKRVPLGQSDPSI